MTEFSRMWKFVRGKSQQHAVGRQKLQKELFSFRKTVQHGFPNKPAALAWDPHLRIAAIGTLTGAIRVFGKCGVEFYGHHSSSENVILKLLFIPNEGRLISLCEGNVLFLWEINDAAIEEIKSLVMEGKKMDKISTLYVDESNENLLVGTEGGDIYSINLNTFTVSENIIFHDVASGSGAETKKVSSGGPESEKKNPGLAVEAIAEQPGNPENLLIGYRRGVIVLWNKETRTAVKTYVKDQQLESFSWDNVGKKFLSSHNDGSYVIWSTESDKPVEEPLTVYGPFPCKPITKIEWCKSIEDGGDNIIVFSGGMPRASYSDRNTVTIQQNTKQVVLDFTSKVIDFFVTYDAESEACESLIILLEEELVAIDLTNTEWQPISLPYLISLHASAVTILTYVNDVSETTWNILSIVGKKQIRETYSDLEWPINGGIVKNTNIEEKTIRRDLLITGHEDGSVRFWNAGTTALSLIYTFKTNSIFYADDEPLDEPVENHAEEEEEEWPPFRKVGSFDPYSDDPRLSIKKICFCGSTGILLVAGSAGQMIISKLHEERTDGKQIKVTTINIIPGKGNPDEVTYLWKGPQKLALKGKLEKNSITIPFGCGYQPFSIVQILPPATVTAIALNVSWYLAAIGTAHGFALYDFKLDLPVLHKCTLNPNDYSSLSEVPISRTKSFKKSLRESFRRIRKGRASSHNLDKSRSSKSSLSPVSHSGANRKRTSDEYASCSNPVINACEIRPVERAIEARPTDDAMGSMVRYLQFFYTTIKCDDAKPYPTLWAGTNSGAVHVFKLDLGSRKRTDAVAYAAAKNLQLRHRAPVISIACLKLPHKLSRTEDHFAIVCSEEQIIIYLLPNMKPIGKVKLTATEGARIRRAHLANFIAGNHTETCLCSLTNLGECIVLSIPDLRRQDTAAVIKREDLNGISSFVFTNYGEGLYMHSSSEIQRITLSASRKTIPQCSLVLANRKLASPAKSEKTASSFENVNGIPEEDEEAEDEEDGRKENGDSKKEEEETKKLPLDHDISAITLDSVKDHLATS